MNFDLKKCFICPLNCGADRTKSRGACGANDKIEISSWNLHFGEEPPISGSKGSGTIFFTHCSLKCSFCQNYPISHYGHGRVYSMEEFEDIMLRLQEEGAHNINFVTPTHYSFHIKEALEKVKIKEKKLKIPIVFNTSGYDKVETLRELEGLVDIYMPDMKFSSDENARKVCNASDYREVNMEAVKEMQRQVGKLKVNSEGIAEKGLLIRHLVLPENFAGTDKIIEFIAEETGCETYLSLMAQYHPACMAVGDKILGRRLNKKEYQEAVNLCRKAKLNNCFLQDF